MARGGFPGMGNMAGLMKQAKKMQEDMTKMQQELEEKEVTATVGGGAVTVKANGKKEIIDIKIKPDVVDPDDVEMLEDLVTSAVNEVIRQVEQLSEGEMKKITGGLGNIPGMF